jgi:hypothetical protein
MPTHFELLKLSFKKLPFFICGGSQCKMGSPDLQEFAALRQQNL